MLKLLEDINATSKRKEKEELLKGYSDPELFKLVAKLSYDPHYTYFIQDFEMPIQYHDVETLEWALERLLVEFNGGNLRGDAAKERLTEILSSLSESDAEVFARVIKRDLRCGVSSSTVNKVWPNTVYVHPYARCSSFNEKNLSAIKAPFFAQTKMDGQYIDIIVNGSVEYRTRQGSYLPLNDEIMDDHFVEYSNGYVLQGEVLVIGDDGKYLPREEGNGIINSDHLDISKVVFVCWDMVDVDDFHAHKTNEVYEDRFARLSDTVDTLSKVSNRIKLVESIVCNSTQDAIDFFVKMVDMGNEGSIIKDFSYKWKHGTIKEQIKMKIIFDCELRVTGWEYGEKGTKYEHLLGKLQVSSEDGSVNFNVGTGFSDKQRKDFLEKVDEWVKRGKVVTVKGNGLVTNKLKPEYYSIYLGRFVEPREDKVMANTYDEIVEIIQSYTKTLQYINFS